MRDLRIPIKRREAQIAPQASVIWQMLNLAALTTVAIVISNLFALRGTALEGSHSDSLQWMVLVHHLSTVSPDFTSPFSSTISPSMVKSAGMANE